MLHSLAPESRSITSPAPLGWDDAMALAVQEMKRLGLGESHRVGAFYAAPDLHAERADFAATVIPRKDRKAGEPKEAAGRVKLLIQCDGKVSVCPFAKRCPRSCKVASRS